MLEELDVPHDRVERGPKLVAHCRQELTLRGVRLLGRVSRVVGLPSRGLRLLSRRFRIRQRADELIVRLFNLFLKRLSLLDLLFELDGEFLELLQQLALCELLPFRFRHVANDFCGADDLSGRTRIGETLSETSIRAPSFRTRTVS